MFQVGLEFFVPAIQIPVEKSGDGIDIPSLMKKVNLEVQLVAIKLSIVISLQGLPQITINIGALILVAMLIITTLLAHLFLNYKPLVIANLLKTLATSFKRWSK